MKKTTNKTERGLWITTGVLESHREETKRKVKRRKKRRTSNHSETFLANAFNTIKESGYKNIKFSSLLKQFGLSRRTDKSIDFINSFLSENDLYALPELTKELSRDTNIQIYDFPVIRIGDIFEYEKELEEFVYQTEAYKQLNFESVIKQYSPGGTKDRLDFKGKDKYSNISVIELKNKGGGKGAVEQVLRYAGQLMRESHNKNVRKILITGIQNYETAQAVYGMTKEEQDQFEWFLYKYNKKNKTISFEQVDYKALSKYFNN